MPTDDEIKEMQRADWNSVADAWDKWDQFLSDSSQHINEWICQGAKLAPGKTVLDLASGSGQPAITAAKHIKPGGMVTALDIAPDMIAVVARKAKRNGLDNVEPVLGDMEDLNYEPGTYDAVTSRFGFMFCPDLPKAFSEAKRVLKRGGRLSFVVWDKPEENKWLSQVIGIMNQVAPGPPPDPKAPGIFRLCDQAELAQLLQGAGFERWEIEGRAFPYEFDGPEHYWSFVTDVAAPLRKRLDSMSEADRAKVKELVLEEAKKIDIGNRVVYNANTLCIWAE
ncbi:MAG: methyltransferase domain-containing protein [Dehalococcoidia bacterium]|nr:methyltransferase domain-containing protein [Dehalococcoidia bacterium]